MEVKIINITLRPKGQKPEQKHRLEEKVREVAYNCAEEVWWDPSLDAARALQRAMKTLADHDEYESAMDILTALYDIVDLDMPCELAAIQKRPDLLELFMDEFLAESDEILDDFTAGGDDPADEDEDGSEGYFEMDDMSD